MHLSQHNRKGCMNFSTDKYEDLTMDIAWDIRNPDLAPVQKFLFLLLSKCVPVQQSGQGLKAHWAGLLACQHSTGLKKAGLTPLFQVKLATPLFPSLFQTVHVSNSKKKHLSLHSSQFYIWESAWQHLLIAVNIWTSTWQYLSSLLLPQFISRTQPDNQTKSTYTYGT